MHWKDGGGEGKSWGTACTPCRAKSGIHFPQIFMHINITGGRDALVPAPHSKWTNVLSNLPAISLPFLGHLGPPSGEGSATQWLEDPRTCPHGQRGGSARQPWGRLVPKPMIRCRLGCPTPLGPILPEPPGSLHKPSPPIWRLSQGVFQALGVHENINGRG